MIQETCSLLCWRENGWSSARRTFNYACFRRKAGERSPSTARRVLSLQGFQDVRVAASQKHNLQDLTHTLKPCPLSFPTGELLSSVGSPTDHNLPANSQNRDWAAVVRQV